MFSDISKEKLTYLGKLGDSEQVITYLFSLLFNIFAGWETYGIFYRTLKNYNSYNIKYNNEKNIKLPLPTSPRFWNDYLSLVISIENKF